MEVKIYENTENNREYTSLSTVTTILLAELPLIMMPS